MIRRLVTGDRMTYGLRTRYYPKTRMGQGIVRMAPWINVTLLVMFFLLLNKQLVMQPGVIVKLPVTPFREGTLSDLIAVVLFVTDPVNQRRDEIVFFDDERYVLRQPEDVDKLRGAFQTSVRKRPASDLVLLADRRIEHGTIAALMDLAAEAGIQRVNLATRPE